LPKEKTSISNAEKKRNMPISQFLNKGKGKLLTMKMNVETAIAKIATLMMNFMSGKNLTAQILEKEIRKFKNKRGCYQFFNSLVVLIY
jgi:hypothetical protein